ncbi:MAG: hypothetical protein HQK66_11290, partial [Desulfamplus sp.]|nr:hypothetical protein [Desulfamplus sp.]
MIKKFSILQKMSFPRWMFNEFVVIVTMFSLFSGFILLFVTLSLVKNRESTILFFKGTALSKSELIAERASSLINSVDMTLVTFISELEKSDSPLVISQDTILKIQRKSLYLGQLNNIFLFDSRSRKHWQLNPWMFQKGMIEEEMDISDFIRAHKEGWMDFHVAPLFKNSRLIGISRSITHIDGTFKGMALAIIDPAVIYQQHYSDEIVDVSQVILFNLHKDVLAFYMDNIRTFLKAEREYPDLFKQSPLVSEQSASVSEQSDSVADFPLFGPLASTVLTGGIRVFESPLSIVAACQLSAFPFYVGVAYDKRVIL